MLKSAINLTTKRQTVTISWSDLHFSPNTQTIHTLATSWQWLLPNGFTPILFSILGDMFFQEATEEVYWLNTGTGEVTVVAKSAEHFNELLASAEADNWFMPNLVEQLHAAGKIPTENQCYTYVTLPIFAEGNYDIENLNPVPASEHFAMTGELLNHLQGLKDGATVNFSIEE